MIYTSYYAMIRKLPKGVVPVAISLGVPTFFDGLVFRELTPTYNSFKDYRNSSDFNLFSERYYKEVLERLNPTDVVHNLYKMSGGQDVCLLCHEKYTSPCHRHLVCEWLKNNGYECEELKL